MWMDEQREKRVFTYDIDLISCTKLVLIVTVICTFRFCQRFRPSSLLNICQGFLFRSEGDPKIFGWNESPAFFQTYCEFASTTFHNPESREAFCKPRGKPCLSNIRWWYGHKRMYPTQQRRSASSARLLWITSAPNVNVKWLSVTASPKKHCWTLTTPRHKSDLNVYIMMNAYTMTSVLYTCGVICIV